METQKSEEKQRKVVVKQWAIRAYIEGKLRLREIAQEAKVSIATVSLWAKAAEIPRRCRGRRELAKPSRLHDQILEALKTTSYAAVGRKFAMAKSQVWAIAKRWERVDEIRVARGAESSAAPTKKPRITKNQESRGNVFVFRLTDADVAHLRGTMRSLGLSALPSLHLVARAVLLQACSRFDPVFNPVGHLPGKLKVAP
ncbi:MAG TPA: hypothetical protein VGR14_14390 [Verrucomicrobiae bacterium]|jgi:hypothetical protein|nr:hypothetical protein [Verrucomicrobiae bacterium]